MAATTLGADGQARCGRLLLDRGAQTTVYVACHDAERTEIGVVLPGQRLAPWCTRHGVSEAIVGGFFTRPDGAPHPRAAIGLAGGRVFAVVCDGRSGREAGLTLTELGGSWPRWAAARP